MKEIFKRSDVKNPEEALQLLKEGNDCFAKDENRSIDVSSVRRKELADGQKPIAVIVGCSDSRVTPTIIFNQGLGDLFEVRIAGNVVGEDAIGSIEYAIEHLHTPLVVILGHQSCGAVTSAVKLFENKVIPEERSPLMDKFEPAIEQIKHQHHAIERSELIQKATEQNVKNVVEQLVKNAVVKKNIETGKLKVVGANYSISSGKVEWFDTRI